MFNFFSKIISRLRKPNALSESSHISSHMKYLIVGLGNIGSEYDETRHNIGFDVVDHIAKEAGIAFTKERNAFIARVPFKGRTLVLLKPTTYMNLSGIAVKYWMDQEKIPADRILVVVDELSLPTGRIRIRPNGSDGGHNGLKSIASLIGQEYPRLRFGIDNNFPKGKQADYVLGKWNNVQFPIVQERIPIAAEACRQFSFVGLQAIMNTYNSSK